jgi:hypothetical protein
MEWHQLEGFCKDTLCAVQIITLHTRNRMHGSCGDFVSFGMQFSHRSTVERTVHSSSKRAVF